MIRGLMYYLSSSGPDGMKNIGDYVQSVAADQFMHATELIEREALHDYDGKRMKVILNGWFMHHPENFPPSSAIEPLFVSFHLRPSMAERLLTPEVVSYMNRHGPIGCRDMSTLRILESHGVPAYFSGCLTLTLGLSFKRAPESECHGVVFVDPFRPFTKADLQSGRWHVFRHPVMALSIYRKLCRQALLGQSWNYRWKRFWQIGAFLRSYRTLFSDELLLNAEYVSHGVRENLFADEASKFAYARELLEEYASAAFCVTSRIHCALPCLGIGTPVVFVNAKSKDMGEGRFEGMLDFFNLADADRYSLKARFDYADADAEGKITTRTKIPVKDAHVSLAIELSERCRRFAEEPCAASDSEIVEGAMK